MDRVGYGPMGRYRLCYGVAGSRCNAEAPAVRYTHTISALDFARNNEARSLPLARGLLYFASSAQINPFAYSGSLIGEMPAYNTIFNSLQGLSDQEAVTSSHGRDLTKFGVLQFDNVQNYIKLW